MSAPTPRTDAAVTLTFAAGHNTVCPNFARTLERELAAERARLDWLEKRGLWESWNGFGETGITLRENIRAAIDAAMKGGNP